MDENWKENMKRDVLAELKPLMEECVRGWLDNQKDTLMLSLVGMLEQEKWKWEHKEEDNAVVNALNELTDAREVFPTLERETGEVIECEGGEECE